MAMYVELSRPMGDVSRWEKILKRIILLNKNIKNTEYFTSNNSNKDILMSVQTILNWYAYAGYPNWRHGALHFVDALEETGYSSAEARDLLIDL